MTGGMSFLILALVVLAGYRVVEAGRIRGPHRTRARRKLHRPR